MVTRRIYRYGYFALAMLGVLGTGCAGAVELDDTDLEVAGQQLELKDAPDVPPVLALPAGNRLAFALDAVGQQLYACRQNATGYGWVFVAPEADLLKPNGQIAGSHYAGPTWEALDGTTVVGARAAGVTVDPTAIPWLLLSAVSHSGEGRMSKISYIHRLDTTGGLAPTTGCDAEHVDAIQGVDYTAKYYFYVPGQ
jgi:hypothetical protein